jgi:hypothetical protein
MRGRENEVGVSRDSRWAILGERGWCESVVDFVDGCGSIPANGRFRARAGTTEAIFTSVVWALRGI